MAAGGLLPTDAQSGYVCARSPGHVCKRFLCECMLLLVSVI